jgi:hypothetical protein
MTTTTTSKPAKWTPDGESFKQFHIVAGNPSDEDLRDRFRHRCYHEHDCCGCFYTFVVSTRRLSNGRVAVRQCGYRNL